jgi:hypothetical protein
MTQNDPDTLTEEEARVLFTYLHNQWAPMNGYREFRTAITKLGKLGKGFACRDCSSLATIPHRLGGFVCEKHKPAAYPAEVDELWHVTKGA